MDPDQVLRLERQVDRLLERMSGLDAERRHLQAEVANLKQERTELLGEVDRILAKLDGLEPEDS